MAKQYKEFMVEDAQIIFRNFAGNEGMYNTAGDRNFCVILTEDAAEDMLADGWNIKRLKPMEVEGEDEEVLVGAPYIKVKLGYKGRPPHVVMMTSRVKTPLSEDAVSVLDWADIEKADLIASAYEWNANGKTGISAYLKDLYVTVRQNALEEKYSEWGNQAPQDGEG